MGFTYDLTTDIGMVRMLVGDTVELSGVLPDGSNFSDEEIQAILDRNDQEVNAAASEILEISSRKWSLKADVQMGPLRENLSQVSRSLMVQAESMRSSSGATAVDFVRNDGYAQEAESE